MVLAEKLQKQQNRVKKQIQKYNRNWYMTEKATK